MAIQDAKKSAVGYDITIKNIGGFTAPFDIVATYEDGSAGTFHQSPAIWALNQSSVVVKLVSKKKIKMIALDGGIFMDADPANNIYKVK